MPAANAPLLDLLGRYRPQGETEIADVERVRALAAAVADPWLQVGGHGDPGESDPLEVALREGVEETGLTDLRPWPDAELRHVAVVNVPASASEPAHQHADLRFVLATDDPDAARPESPGAPLRWLSPGEACELTSEPNFREALSRVERLLAGCVLLAGERLLAG